MAQVEEIINIQVVGGQEAEKQMYSVQQSINANRQAQKDLTDAYKAGLISEEAYAKGQVQLKNESKELNATQRNLQKSTLAVEGSYNALSAEMTQLLKEQKNINLNTKEGQAEYDRYGKQINSINDKLKDLDKTNGINNRNVGSYTDSIKEATKGLNIMGVNVGQATEQVKNMAQTAKNLLVPALVGTKQATESASQGASLAVREYTILSTTIKATSTASGAATKAMKIFRVALASTGIGALIVALGSLVTWLSTTQAGMDLVTSVTRPLSAVFDRLIGIVQELGGKVFKRLAEAVNDPKQALIDLGDFVLNNLLNRFKALGGFVESIALVFQDEWVKAAKKATDSAIMFGTGVENATDKVGALGKELGSSINEAAEIGERIDKLTKSFELLEIENAKAIPTLRARINTLRLLAESEDETAAARVKALQEAAKLEDEIADRQAQELKNKLERAQIEAELNDTDRATMLEIAKLEGELAKNEGDRDKAKIRLQTRLNSLQKQSLKITTENNSRLKKDYKELLDLSSEIVDDIIEIRKAEGAFSDLFKKEDVDVDFDIDYDDIENFNNQIEKADESYQEGIATLKKYDEAQQKTIENREKLNSAIETTSLITQSATDAIIAGYEFQLKKELALNEEKRQTELKRNENDKKAQAKINEKYDKLADETQKSNALKQQRLAIANAIIQGALGIVKTGANLGYPAAIPFQIAQGVQTGIQVATIKSQQFAEGGRVWGAGTATSDSIPARLSNGETVINARSSEMFTPILSAINQAGGGVAFARGGQVGNVSQTILNSISLDSQFDKLAARINSIKIVQNTPTANAAINSLNTLNVNNTL